MYDANGASSGTAPVDTKHYDTGDKVIILQPPAEMVYAGHSFVCWNTRADGEGDNYTKDQSLQMPARNLILYAKWTANQYTITYDKNDGS
ncbi:MAG TPA: InlB B-repeat-containing protein, partial [Methanocorpusculum sp.]|nr:InlB B-repeat-containing protein [Methanocorpusculum sp.]